MKKKILFISGCVILICLAIFGYKAYEISQQESVEDLQIPLCDVKVEDVARIEIKGGNTQTFIKKEGLWYNEALPSVNYDQTLMNHLIEQISGLTSMQIIKNPEDVGRYGINENSKLITLYTTTNEAYTYRMGAPVPESNALYVWNDQKEKLALVADKDLASFMMPTGEMIEHELEVPQIETAFTIVQNQERILELKKQQDKWYVYAPFKDRQEVDEEWFASATHYLKDFTKDKVIETATPLLPEYGLDKPSWIIEINDKTFMKIGKLVNGYYYFKVAGDEAIYGMQEGKVKGLEQVEPFAIIKKSVQPFEETNLKKLEVTHGTEQYILSFEKPGEVTLNEKVITLEEKEVLIEGLKGLTYSAYLKDTAFEENNPRPAETTLKYTFVNNTEKTFEYVPYDPTNYLLRQDGHIEFSVNKEPMVKVLNALNSTLKAQTEQ